MTTSLHQAKFRVQFLHTLGIEILIVEVERSQYEIEHNDVQYESVEDIVECH